MNFYAHGPPAFLGSTFLGACSRQHCFFLTSFSQLSSRFSRDLLDPAVDSKAAFRCAMQNPPTFDRIRTSAEGPSDSSRRSLQRRHGRLVSCTKCTRSDGSRL
jgi:hypothetical protein